MASDREFATAIETGNVDVVRALIRRMPEIVNAPGWTPPPLHCAVLWDQPEVAEVLLENGAEIERLDPDRETTPLRYAVMYAKPRMLRLLAARGGNAGAILDGGTTAVQLAKNAQAGEFKEFDDLPRPSEFTTIVELLTELCGDD